jgi:predicted nucleic acid-binding protein
MEGMIDTSVLVDYILLDSELHERAKSGLETLEHGFLPTVVIEELVHVLKRLKLDKRTIDGKLHEVLASYEVVVVNKKNILEAAEIIMREEAASFEQFNDKLILSAAKENGLPLLTFDKDLIKECKANGVKSIE